MVIDAHLKHHTRGHWTLQWQCPDRNVWRVEHFRNEKEARDYTRFTGWHEWKITKQLRAGRYSQVGYWHGN